MRVLITGVAGFIGFHTAKALIEQGHSVCGVDNLNDYYDVELKKARLDLLRTKVRFYETDIADSEHLKLLFRREAPDVVIHLAAQAGVRYSMENPVAYAHANMLGHVSVLEACRRTPSVARMIYASSSSVYGASQDVPFRESEPLGAPQSVYAATKVSCEQMSRTFSDLYDMDLVGLRFFTVYGPWGRPDMAYWIFAQKIMNGETIKMFNNGDIRRDFTYIDDVVGSLRLIAEAAQQGKRGHEIYNVGNHTPEPVPNLVQLIEQKLKLRANIEFAPLPPGDMVETFANVDKLQRDYGFSPSTSLKDGLSEFLDWWLLWSARSDHHRAISVR